MLNYRESIGRSRREQEEKDRLIQQIQQQNNKHYLNQHQLQGHIETFNNSQQLEKNRLSYQNQSQSQYQDIIGNRPSSGDSKTQREDVRQFVSKPNYGEIFYGEDPRNKSTNDHLRNVLEKERSKFNDLVKYLKDLEAENIFLKSQRGMNNSEDNEYFSMTPGVRAVVTQKFRELKSDNDQLRKITVSLLKNQGARYENRKV